MKTKINLNFVDINITNTINKKYKFKMHCKKDITNILIKPTLCIDPNTIKSVFKGLLHRAHSICSQKYIKEEEKFLIDVFIENGHSKQLLKNLVIKYNNKKNKKNNHKNSTENRDYKNLKKLPWIPNISPKKKQFKKKRKDIVFTSGKNLQQILCQKKKKNQTSQPGVYQLDCLQWEMYWLVKKEGSHMMHGTSTGQHEWKMGIMWGYRANKRMPWTIRLAATENSTHFTILVRKENLGSV